MTNCPVCDNKLKDISGRRFDCVVCGSYFTNAHAEGYILTELKKEGKRYILSGILREASEYGNPIKLTGNNIQDILDSTSVSDSPFQAIDRIIKYIHRKSPTAASSVGINSVSDYPIAYAKDKAEFLFYLNKAVKLNYLESLDLLGKYRLDVKGWERLDELNKKQVESNQAFVAMWFDKKMDKAWKEGFEPALKETGYNPIRIDLVEHNEKICDRIIADIRKSGLLVADFTGNRGGVYFEAGFAKGLGVPVIWTCRKDHLDDVHFDTRQFNHIEWEKPEDLKKQLVDRIEATLPNRVRKQGVV